MNLEIRFGKTRSPRREDAIRQAEKIPGFSKPDGARVEMVVATRVPFESPEQWRRIEALLSTVASWQSTVVLVDGRQIDPGQLSADLSQVVACYKKKQTTDPSLDYCSGKERPSADISAFGCRLMKGVDLRDWGRGE